MQFNNKTILISGGSRGIGKAVALNFAKRGGNLALIYNGSEKAAAEVCEEAQGFGVKAVAYKCNVANFNECEKTVTDIINEFETIDVLINNAGITRDNLLIKMSEQDFDDVIAVNLKGCFNLIKNTIRVFLKQKSGRIINISSVSGMMGNSGQANYSASKAGIIGLTKSIAKEIAPRGITCNAIAPGFIKTDMVEAMSEDAVKAACEGIPMKKIGEPDDIAGLAMFLASNYAKYITGEVIKADGGLYI